MKVWNAILEAGTAFGIKPCGLGARNTLRLEAAMSLYGHEIGASITPSTRGSAGSSKWIRAISWGATRWRNSVKEA